MSNVLGTVKDPKSEAGQEVSRRKVASHRSKRKSGSIFEKLRPVNSTISTLIVTSQLNQLATYTSSNCGMLSSRYPQYLMSKSKLSLNSLTACFLYNRVNFLKITPQVRISSGVYSALSIGSPLERERERG